jgi:hypothetical protein
LLPLRRRKSPCVTSASRSTKGPSGIGGYQHRSAIS